MHFRHERRGTIGSRPGALGDTPSNIQRITVVDYDEHEVLDQEFESLDKVLKYARSKRTTWVHFQGEAGSDDLRQLREAFGIHPLAVEDVMNIGQRPKFEPYDRQLFFIDIVVDRAERGIEFEQVSVFLGKDYVISFHAGDKDVFEPVRRRIHEGKGRIRIGGADYLAYCLTDVLVDLGFPIIEGYADELEHLEDEIFTQRSADPIETLHRIRSDLTAIRRMIWHQTNMLNDLISDDHDMVQHETLPYFRDAADHSQRVQDLLETYRDMASNLLDTHLSLVSHRMNDVMKVLTLIATTFIPLSFVAGVYGMNFDTNSPWNMPELSHPYGYPILIGTMLLIFIGMLFYFRKKRWL